MTDQDLEYFRFLTAMQVFNGLLSRLNPDEIDVEGAWDFVDDILEASDRRPEGIVAIKTKRKYTRKI